MKVANYMEFVVWERLDDVLSGIEGVCPCESCKSDIAAIALNNLKPHYYSTDKGYLFSKLRSVAMQDMTDVILQVTAAAECVKVKPRHGA